MKIYTYGEDALTLWALKNRLSDIIGKKEKDPVIFFRPSFGRRGGSQFGEFDFIVITKEKVFLGESKWESSGEIKDNIVTLRDEQKKRHAVMRDYIRSIYKYGREILDWDDFGNTARKCIKKPIPKKKSRLAQNLKTFLNKVYDKTEQQEPKIENILLMILREENNRIKTVPGFKLKRIIYSSEFLDNFLMMEI